MKYIFCIFLIQSTMNLSLLKESTVKTFSYWEFKRVQTNNNNLYISYSYWYPLYRRARTLTWLRCVMIFFSNVTPWLQLRANLNLASELISFVLIFIILINILHEKFTYDWNKIWRRPFNLLHVFLCIDNREIDLSLYENRRPSQSILNALFVICYMHDLTRYLIKMIYLQFYFSEKIQKIENINK